MYFVLDCFSESMPVILLTIIYHVKCPVDTEVAAGDNTPSLGWIFNNQPWLLRVLLACMMNRQRRRDRSPN